jgi:ribosome-binding factor A
MLKAAEAIREVVSMAILVEIKDPRVRDVTVTRVEMTPDMRAAKVYVSVMGDEKKQTLSLRGLESSAGFLQTKVAKRIDTRFTPRLSFVLDQGVKKQLEVLRILKEVLPPDEVSPLAGTEPQASDEMVQGIADDRSYHDGDTVMDDSEEM